MDELTNRNIIFICYALLSFPLLFPEITMTYLNRFFKKWESFRYRMFLKKREATEAKMKKYWVVDVKKLH